MSCRTCRTWKWGLYGATIGTHPFWYTRGEICTDGLPMVICNGACSLTLPYCCWHLPICWTPGVSRTNVPVSRTSLIPLCSFSKGAEPALQVLLTASLTQVLQCSCVPTTAALFLRTVYYILLNTWGRHVGRNSPCTSTLQFLCMLLCSTPQSQFNRQQHPAQ